MSRHRSIVALLAASILSALTSATGPASVALGGEPQPEWTLFSPNGSTTTYLIDLDGVIQHQWPSAYRPGNMIYLLEGGALLRTCNDMAVAGFQAGGRGGRLQRLAWDGTVEWNYLLADADKRQHHDVCRLPNGNIIAIVWERKTAAEAIAVGRNPATLGAGELWSEMLLEIQPSGATGGTIVWQWHVWDHLVQNFDATKPNFAVGGPSSRPERININYPAGGGGPVAADWLHANGLDYNAALDQIVLSLHNSSEIWIISHNPAHASGGDLLYRWGNPAAYGLGTAADQKYFGQHNPRWIADGLSGAGDILVFNNGLNRPAGAFSTVEQLRPPLNPDGSYARTAGQPFGPAAPVWMCDNASGVQFYSSNISGAQRLANGNTLICVGASGRFIELDSACQSVWQYTNPFTVGGAGVFRAARIGDRDPRLEGLLWCAADFNGDGAPSVQDIFDFLAAYFSGNARADVNNSGGITVQDIFDFLAAYFVGCS